MAWLEQEKVGMFSVDVGRQTDSSGGQLGRSARVVTGPNRIRLSKCSTHMTDDLRSVADPRYELNWVNSLFLDKATARLGGLLTLNERCIRGEVTEF